MHNGKRFELKQRRKLCTLGEREGANKSDLRFRYGLTGQFERVRSLNDFISTKNFRHYLT